VTTLAPDSAPPDSAPAMSIFQRTAVRWLMGGIMFLTGTYVGFDWAGFFHHFTSSYSRGAGYARSILCALMVALIGHASVDRRDQLVLGGAFVLTLAGDYCLVLNDYTLPGTAIFAVVHVLLIYRHARGLLASLAPAERSRTILFSVVTGIVAYGGSLILVIAVSGILQRTGMFAIDVAYLALLATSLWVGWGTLIRRFFDRRNAWYIAIGMTCFYFCDVIVGLSTALMGNPDPAQARVGQVLHNLVGFFYTPALVLLAYSGYRWRKVDRAPPPSVR
jgi:hypothetical protein